jgi:hypothetical protein
MGFRPRFLGRTFGRTFDSTFAPVFTFVGIGSLIGVMNVLATRCAETFNFIAVLGYPLGGDPWPISTGMGLSDIGVGDRHRFISHSRFCEIAVDVLDSTSTMLQPWIVGEEHYD